MTISDLDAPTSVSRSTYKRSLWGSLRLGIPGILVFALAAAGAAQSYAQDQDVAEAARQERARKQSQQKKPRHVYTAEDLKRAHILSPEDRAQVEARKNQLAPAGPQKPQDTVDGSAVASDSGVQSLPANAPLGDVARRMRRQKESQKLQRSAEFHLPFGDVPALASPKPPVQPLRPPISATKPAPPLAVPFHPPVKRSPFERPRFMAPTPAAPSTFVPPLPASRVLPAAPPARVAPSLSAKLTVVTIQPGDSLWKLAAQRLGVAAAGKSCSPSIQAYAIPISSELALSLFFPLQLRWPALPPSTPCATATRSGPSRNLISATVPPGPASPVPILPSATSISSTQVNCCSSPPPALARKPVFAPLNR